MRRARWLLPLLLLLVLPQPHVARAEPRPAPPAPLGVVGNVAISVRADEQAAIVKLMTEAGVQWSREEISWERLQPEKGGRFLWSGTADGFGNYDSAISRQAAAGIEVLGLLAYNPAWYKGQNATVGDWIDDWYAFVYATVARYGRDRDQVHAWEVWNEPNLRIYGYENGLYHIEDYVQVLRTAQRAIRAADPTATIVLGGVTAVWSDPPSFNYDILSYLTMLGDAGGWDTFDVLAVHPYRPGAPEDAFWRRDRFVDFDDELRDISRLLDHYGRKPIWFTEISWSSYEGFEGHTEQEQAWLLTRLYAMTLSHPEVERIFWYNLRNTPVSFTPYEDAASDPNHPEYNFGLLRRTYPLQVAEPTLRKPAFVAFRTLHDLIGSLPLEATVADGKRADLRRVYWYRWGIGSQHVEVLWRMADAWATSVVIECGCAEVRLRGWDGRLLRIVQAEAGRVTVNLPQPGEPLFVEYGPSSHADQDGLLFSETGHSLSGRFLRYWQNHGGLAQFGFPITDVLIEPDPTSGVERQVQYFERNRFEYFPEFAGTRYEVQLGLLGNGLLAQQGIDWHSFPSANTTPRGCRRFVETQHVLCPPFRAYWEQQGGLAIYGLPLSDPFEENGRLVQYFERNRFEHHPEFAGTRYEVLLGLLGRELFSGVGVGP